MCEVPDRPEIPKKAFHSDLSQFLNSNLSKTEALISSINFSIQSLTFVDEHSTENSMILIFASES